MKKYFAVLLFVILTTGSQAFATVVSEYNPKDLIKSIAKISPDFFDPSFSILVSVYDAKTNTTHALIHYMAYRNQGGHPVLNFGSLFTKFDHATQKESIVAVIASPSSSLPRLVTAVELVADLANPNSLTGRYFVPDNSEPLKLRMYSSKASGALKRLEGVVEVDLATASLKLVSYSEKNIIDLSEVMFRNMSIEEIANGGIGHIEYNEINGTGWKLQINGKNVVIGSETSRQPSYIPKATTTTSRQNFVLVHFNHLGDDGNRRSDATFYSENGVVMTFGNSDLNEIVGGLPRSDEYLFLSADDSKSADKFAVLASNKERNKYIVAVYDAQKKMILREVIDNEAEVRSGAGRPNLRFVDNCLIEAQLKLKTALLNSCN